ncbi:MAG: hypothetical protein IJ387_06595 [Thermoguttaceae bacterium]|nr:hypothetical protein [Thermoguttaceae bacterium]
MKGIGVRPLEKKEKRYILSVQARLCIEKTRIAGGSPVSTARPSFCCKAEIAPSSNRS